MVERIKEIGGKANVKTFFEPEVLVDRQVVIPPARPNEVYARVGVVKSTEGGIETRSIAQRDGKLANKCSRAVRTRGPNRRRSESTANRADGRGVEIAGEPLAE